MEVKNHGFIYRAPEIGDYKQTGRLTLGGAALQPDGQWDAYLPKEEVQNLAMEPQACASFGTLNAVEALARQEFGDISNWSDRFLAKVSGTTQNGNDPHTVAETLRRKGCVYESSWPYTKEITSWDKYYAEIPMDLMAIAQAEFKGNFDFGHQYVGTNPQQMMLALMYSPLGADVSAWDFNDIHKRFGPSNHWVCIYGYVEGQYWKCYDSYSSSHKKLAWDFGFTMVKQYTLHRAVLKRNVVTAAWNWILGRIGLPQLQIV